MASTRSQPIKHLAYIPNEIVDSTVQSHRHSLSTISAIPRNLASCLSAPIRLLHVKWVSMEVFYVWKSYLFDVCQTRCCCFLCSQAPSFLLVVPLPKVDHRRISKISLVHNSLIFIWFLRSYLWNVVLAYLTQQNRSPQAGILRRIQLPNAAIALGSKPMKVP